MFNPECPNCSANKWETLQQSWHKPYLINIFGKKLKSISARRCTVCGFWDASGYEVVEENAEDAAVITKSKKRHIELERLQEVANAARHMLRPGGAIPMRKNQSMDEYTDVDRLAKALAELDRENPD